VVRRLVRAWTRSGFLSLALLGLAGCANLPPPDPPPARPSADRPFEVNGRFAVRFGEEGGSGRILWTHSPAADDLRILSPIGTGLAHIVRENGMYTLTTPDNVNATERDPDVLTERVLGWRLPLGGLPYWLRGRADPALPSETRLDGAQRVAELKQAGWTIEYQSYHLESGLPERLRVRRDKLDLRLILEEWKARE
jgi:outer membrane lipoprotein LolB